MLSCISDIKYIQLAGVIIHVLLVEIYSIWPGGHHLCDIKKKKRLHFLLLYNYFSTHLVEIFFTSFHIIFRKICHYFWEKKNVISLYCNKIDYYLSKYLQK